MILQIILYCIFSLNITATTVAYIYHLFKRNNISKNFFLFNLFGALSFMFWIIFYEIKKINEGFDSIRFFTLDKSMELLAMTFFMIFIYEVFEKNKKEIYKKIVKILFFINITISILSLIFAFSRFERYSNVYLILCFVGIILIVAKNMMHLENKQKNILLFIFILVILSSVIGVVLQEKFNVDEDIFTYVIYNLFIISILIYEIKKIIDIVKNKMIDIEDDLSEKTINLFEKFNITAREKDVVFCILDGKTNQEIADELFISLSTVKIHIYNIYKKFNVKKRRELVHLINNKK